MSATEASHTFPAHHIPAIRQVMMPRDTNALGTIFGGVILAQIDLAASVEAHKHYSGNVVTVAVDQVEFRQPVQVGDVVSFFAETVSMGRTSMRIKVSVWAQRKRGGGENVYVTEAFVTLVAVDDKFRPIAIRTSK